MILVATIFRQRTLDLIRYPFELVFGFIAAYVIFLVVFFAARTFGGAGVATGDSLSAIVVGYVVFTILQQAFQDFGGYFSAEASQGTLEQLAMSRYGLLTISVTDFFVQAIFQILRLGIVIVPIMATTGRWLTFDLPSLLPLLVLTVVGVVGLGLALGSLALVFKRVSGVISLVSLGILGLVAAPVDRIGLLKLLPVAHGNYLMRQVLVHGERLWEFPAGQIALLGGVSGAYLLVGCVVFRAMERVARDKALLGQY